MSNNLILDYLDWQSDVSPESVFAGFDQNSYPQFWQNGLVYLSSLKRQQGRAVMVYQLPDRSVCLTPEPFNCRTRISEYGGKPYWLSQDCLYFANYDDQCLFQQTWDGESVSKPKRITPKPDKSSLYMFTDVIQVSQRYLLAIVEIENRCADVQESENISQIVSIDLDKPNAAPITLVDGADFYSNLVFDTQHRQLAWVQWNHSHMPWDETQLWTAGVVMVEDQLAARNKAQIELEASASVCQLCFASNGKLFFSADYVVSENVDDIRAESKNYWNIYSKDLCTPGSPVQPVTQDCLEYGYPHWQYGDVRIVQWTASHLLAFGSSPLGDQLIKIDQDSLVYESFATTGITYQNLSADGKGNASVILLSRDCAPSLAVLNTGLTRFEPLAAIASPISSKPGEPGGTGLAKEEVSYAEHIEFETPDGKTAYGFYYAPVNVRYDSRGGSESGRKPPLLVMVHGGPTARAYGFFDIQKQFWTQRGFAVLDVNYRGSSGYGRAYRDALYGEWGVLDTHDIVAGIEYLIATGKADPERICIRGKSAGGYAVLRALTEYPKIFRAGACYYGIGNLVTLAESTHKFEKHYTDRLIGEAYTAELSELKSSAFQLRSPINKIDHLKCAMIVFQGSLDKVVPPPVAHEIIEVLKHLDLPYSYVEYADEGHGFRQVANNIDACSRELEFYRSSLSTQQNEAS